MLTTTAGDIVFIGLTHDDVHKASGANVVLIDGETLGIEGKRFVLMFGETHEEMRERLIRTADESIKARGEQ